MLKKIWIRKTELMFKTQFLSIVLFWTSSTKSLLNVQSSHAIQLDLLHFLMKLLKKNTKHKESFILIIRLKIVQSILVFIFVFLGDISLTSQPFRLSSLPAGFDGGSFGGSLLVGNLD